MKIQFQKYQGAGNDFVIIDNRIGTVALTSAQIAFLCDRRFGVGGDGLMLLESAPDADFRMVYFNADGNESTMCGNGGRCIAAFAKAQGIVGDNMRFTAIDGTHHAELHDDGNVSLHMADVQQIKQFDDHYELDTGSPHYVMFVVDLKDTDVFKAGRRIRNYSQFAPKGINVNFVERVGEGLHIRTYERGVENETLACGTGVTAAAIVSTGEKTGSFNIPVKAMGGDLSVRFEKKDSHSATGVILRGPAQFVFAGEITLTVP